jgi:hypothetical protein
MCGDACEAIATMESAVPLSFLCVNLTCVASGVAYVPDDFDTDAWLAEWGTQWNTP